MKKGTAVLQSLHQEQSDDTWNVNEKMQQTSLRQFYRRRRAQTFMMQLQLISRAHTQKKSDSFRFVTIIKSPKGCQYRTSGLSNPTKVNPLSLKNVQNGKKD